MLRLSSSSSTRRWASRRSLFLSHVHPHPHVHPYSRPHSCYAGNGVLGLVRESRFAWERRAPLAPQHVRELTKMGFRVLVQPCTKRIYRDSEYLSAGATITEDLSPASLIMGVKQIPEELLMEDKNYLFFSHTIKAQPANMPLLDNILSKNIRLFDYECITEGPNRGGPRLVAFGKYAGLAGMIDILQGLGQRLLAGGINTPFLNVSQCYTYENLELAIRAVKRAGERLAREPLPWPVVFAFTGSGNVAQGSREIFELLPHKYISVEQLPEVCEQVKNGKLESSVLYAVRLQAKDIVAALDGKPFERQLYYSNPDKFTPIFHKRVAPYVNVIVNGMYWDPRFPRLLTKPQLRSLRRSGNNKLLAVADITCDVNGSIEFLTHSTDIERPFFNYVPETDESQDLVTDDGLLMLGVDILPSELPTEASIHFGNALLPLLPALLQAAGTNTHEDARQLPPEWYRACIASHKGLMPMYSYIDKLRSHACSPLPETSSRQLQLVLRGHLFDTGLINRALDMIESSNVPFSIQNCLVRPNVKGSLPTPSSIEILLQDQETTQPTRLDTLLSTLRELALNHPLADAIVQVNEIECSQTKVNVRKRVLLLGSGMVAAPTVELLGEKGDVSITIASDVRADGQRLASIAKQGEYRYFRFPGVPGELDELVSRHDVIISLLPAVMHADVARVCLKHKRHMVTASYVSPDMRALHDSAVQNGVSIINEVGLDPGIDHMMIMKSLDDIRSRGGRISQLYSVCGGLPDVSAANNPFMYKFSWSPRGVLNATQNEAQYRVDGKMVKVSGENLLVSEEPFDRLPALNLEVYPNRDAMTYAKVYGVEDADTIFRGTLRYRGWCNNMYAFKALGLLSTAPLNEAPSSWSSLLAARNPTSSLFKPGLRGIDPTLLVAVLHEKAVKDPTKAVAALSWLGVLGEDPIHAATGSTPMDILCNKLTQALKFDDTERDLVAMYHSVVAQFADDDGRCLTEHHNSWLLMTGDQRRSAMAATVGYTCGAAAELLLTGQVTAKGILTPTSREIYAPVLERLQGLGITFGESVVKSPQM